MPTLTKANKGTPFVDQYPVPYLSVFRYVYECIYHNRPIDLQEVTIFGSRFGGKTHAYMWLALRCLLIGLPVTIYIFRYFKYDVIPTIWSEFNNKLIGSGVSTRHIKRHITEKWFKFGRCSVYFKGLHQTRKDKIVLKGLFEFTTPYCLAIFEECDEVEPEEISDIATSIRGDHPDARLLTIACGNPYNMENPFSRYFDEYLQYDEDRMRGKGWYSHLATDSTWVTNLRGEREEVQTTRLFIRNSIVANPYAISNPDTMRKVENWRLTNPLKYRAWYWGRPVRLTGGVFTELLDNFVSEPLAPIKQLAGDHYFTYLCGVDVGIVNSATAVVLVGRAEREDGMYSYIVLDSYYIDNRNRADALDVSLMVVAKIQQWGIKWPWLQDDGLAVDVDNADPTFIDLLNNKRSAYTERWLDFLPCKKRKVKERVGLLLGLLKEGRMSKVRGACPQLDLELERAEWDPEARQARLVKENDHCIDAFIYATGRDFHGKLFSEDQMDLNKK